MKKDNLGLKNFVIRCIFNDCMYSTTLSDGETYRSALDKILEESTDTADFAKRFLADTRLESFQGYQVLMKEVLSENEICDFLRMKFAEHGCFATISDAGGVKVGNDEFSVVFTNGYGDGETLVAIYEGDEPFKWSSLLEFQTAINCAVAYVYDYDCGGEPTRKLFGRYGVYSGYGLVAFEKWD